LTLGGKDGTIPQKDRADPSRNKEMGEETYLVDRRY
jgi:hypothetical protein